MDGERKRRIQIILLVGVLLAGARLGYIFYQRHQAEAPPPPRFYALQADDYVRPPKIYAYDLPSAVKEIARHDRGGNTAKNLAFYGDHNRIRATGISRHVSDPSPPQKRASQDSIMQ